MAIKINNETKIGAFTLIAVTALILGYSFMKGNNLFSHNNIYYVKYDNVGGLALSNTVNLNGLTVGKVIDLYRDKNTGKNIARLSVDPDIKIPKGTVAKIASSGLLGSLKIDLLFSDAKEILKDGDELMPDVEKDLKAQVSAEFQPIKEKADQLMSSIDSTITVVRSIFNEQTRNNLQQSVNSIRGTLTSIEQTVASFNDLMKNNIPELNNIFSNIESVSANLKSDNGKINSLISNLSTMTDSLKAANLALVITNLKNTLTQIDLIMKKIQTGQGSLGALVNDDKLYKDLDHASQSLDTLINSIKTDGVRIRLGGKKGK